MNGWEISTFILMAFGVSLLGGFSLVSDVLENKIYNKHIKWSLLLALCIQILNIIQYFPNLTYIKLTILNVAITVSLSFVFWYFGLWSAGDSKAYLVFTLLIPLSWYQQVYYHWWPSFELLLNIFICMFLYIFFIIIKDFFIYIFITPKKLPWKHIKPFLQQHSVIKEILPYIILLITAYSVYRVIRVSFEVAINVIIPIDTFSFIVLFILLIHFFPKQLFGKVFYAISAILLLAFVVLISITSSTSLLKEFSNMSLLSLALIIYRYVYVYLWYPLTMREIPLTHLSQNMSLAIPTKNELARRMTVYENPFQLPNYEDGLNDEELSLVKDVLKEMPHIHIEKHMKLFPAMLFAVVFTINHHGAIFSNIIMSFLHD